MFVCVFSLALSSLFAQAPVQTATEPSLKAAEIINVRNAGYLPNNGLADEQYNVWSRIGVLDFWRQYGFAASNPGDDAAPTVVFVGAGVNCNVSQLVGKCDPRSRSFIFDDVYNDTSGADTFAATSVFSNLNDGSPIAGFSNARILALQVWKNKADSFGRLVQDYSPDNAELAFRFLLAQEGTYIVHVSLHLQSTPSLDAVFQQMVDSGRFMFVGAALDQVVEMGRINSLPCSKSDQPGVLCLASVSANGNLVPGGYGANITGTSVGSFVWGQALNGKYGSGNGNYLAAVQYTATAALLQGKATASGHPLTPKELKDLMLLSLRFEKGLISNISFGQVGVPGVLDVNQAYTDLLAFLEGEPLPTFSTMSFETPVGGDGKPLVYLSRGTLRLKGTGFSETTQFRFNGAVLKSSVVDETTVDVEVGDEVVDNVTYSSGVLYAIQTYKGRPVAQTWVPIISPVFLAP